MRFHEDILHIFLWFFHVFYRLLSQLHSQITYVADQEQQLMVRLNNWQIFPCLREAEENVLVAIQRYTYIVLQTIQMKLLLFLSGTETAQQKYKGSLTYTQKSLYADLVYVRTCKWGIFALERDPLEYATFESGFFMIPWAFLFLNILASALKNCIA
jgi:hypothetical protein